MKSGVAKAHRAPLSFSRDASCGPVSSPESGTTQAPALTAPNITSSISTELPIITATRSPRWMPTPSSALATRFMFSLKLPHVLRTEPQTTASLCR